MYTGANEERSTVEHLWHERSSVKNLNVVYLERSVEILIGKDGRELERVVEIFKGI